MVDVERLNTASGRELVARAQKLLRDDPSRAAVRLRHHTTDPALASEALVQAELRDAAATKFSENAQRFFFTRDGLEQASRAVVAERRALRLMHAGATHVADLCCGIGGDAITLAQHGMRVLAVDHSANIANVAQTNAHIAGFGDTVTVRCADAREVDLSEADAMFADPARRKNGKRMFNPAAYSPPLDDIWRVSAHVTNRVAKVAPGIDHGFIPDDAEAEWVSVDGSVVEAALWRGPVASPCHRASVITGNQVTELTGSGRRFAERGEIGEYLYEPDGAVIRAHLVAELADMLTARVGHENIAYLYGDTEIHTYLARTYRILDTLPFNVKRLRQYLQERGVGRVTIKKRGADIVPDRLRKDLKLSGDNEALVVVTRVAGAHTALICEYLPS